MNLKTRKRKEKIMRYHYLSKLTSFVKTISISIIIITIRLKLSATFILSIVIYIVDHNLSDQLNSDILNDATGKATRFYSRKRREIQKQKNKKHKTN